jgi:deoxyhypusine monooxygenase
MASEDLGQHVGALGAILINVERPLAERFRALFTLRNISGNESVTAIAGALHDDSVLLKHECAYCLGQMQNPFANSYLVETLIDENQDVMVRHEAGEALGAIASPESLDVLLKYCSDSRPEIAETCQIAVDRIRWMQTDQTEQSANPYLSVDPAPACGDVSVEDLRVILLNSSLSLFQRYRAMFALRNRGGKEAVAALVDGLGDSSALFRHEIGYVLGQMQDIHSIEGLKKRLVDEGENYMVRHECAEALGSIATDECLPVLHQFKQDSARVVSESCVVALDMLEFEQSGEMHYASVDLVAEKAGK